MIRHALLLTQGLWTAHRAVRLPAAAGEGAGVVGSGKALRLLGFGDSIIAGVGVTRTDQALTARLAEHLARLQGRCVHWEARGRSGARSRDLLRSLERFPDAAPSPDLVLVSNGINDATAPCSEAHAQAALQGVLRELRRRFPGALICQLGVPPLGEFPALPQPLRTVLGRRAGRLDAGLARWIASRPRVEHLPFERSPDPAHFARDGYHPGPIGVDAWAQALAPRIHEALRVRQDEDDRDE